MFYRDVGYLGSLMESLPEEHNQYLDRGFLVHEWKIGTEVNECYIIQKRERPDFKEITFNVIDAFNGLFPQEIISDAKRIIFDVQIHMGNRPSFMGLAAIYLSCKIHGKESLFKDDARTIKTIYNNYSRTTKQTPSIMMNRVLNLVKRFESELPKEKLELMRGVNG